uniref:Sm domain-containing protein n=1 Tax=Heterorhabditis bacteriophora TaxID=37862 RepID=A0A1I7WIE7_HETBA
MFMRFMMTRENLEYLLFFIRILLQEKFEAINGRYVKKKLKVHNFSAKPPSQQLTISSEYRKIMVLSGFTMQPTLYIKRTKSELYTLKVFDHLLNIYLEWNVKKEYVRLMRKNKFKGDKKQQQKNMLWKKKGNHNQIFLGRKRKEKKTKNYMIPTFVCLSDIISSIFII